MRMLVVALVVCLVGGPAAGIVDPTPDLLGLYFEESADTYCLEWLAPYTPFDMYAVYTNPTVPEITGFEFGLEIPGDLMILQTSVACNPFWDPVEDIPYVVSCGYPLPVSEAAVLVHFRFMNISISTEPIHFFMHAAEVPSIPGENPVVYLPGGSLLPLLVRGAPDQPTALIFDDCTVDTQPTSWDSLKAIYR